MVRTKIVEDNGGHSPVLLTLTFSSSSVVGRFSRSFEGQINFTYTDLLIIRNKLLNPLLYFIT